MFLTLQMYRFWCNRQTTCRNCREGGDCLRFQLELDDWCVVKCRSKFVWSFLHWQTIKECNMTLWRPRFLSEEFHLGRQQSILGLFDGRMQFRDCCCVTKQLIQNHRSFIYKQTRQLSRNIHISPSFHIRPTAFIHFTQIHQTHHHRSCLTCQTLPVLRTTAPLPHPHATSTNISIRRPPYTQIRSLY